jgi:hypothetical protein
MNYEETLTTLQFASRAIKIKVEAKINEKVEMRKKEKLVEFKNIKSIDGHNDVSKKYEKQDYSDLKSINNLRNDLKLSRSRSQVDDVSVSNDNTELIKKFQMMVLHLQNELSKNVKIY